MTLLDLDTPLLDLHGPEDHAARAGRCRCCRHKLLDPVSLAYGIGPDCRKRLGIAPRKPVRITGVETWRDCEGQTDLLEETT